MSGVAAFIGDPLFSTFRVGDFALRAYRRGDERRIKLRADFAAAYEAAGRRLADGLIWTLTRDGWPLAVGGLEPDPNEPDVWHAWALTADMTPRAWAFGWRAAKAVLTYAEDRLGALRIEASAAADNSAARFLLARLHFAGTGETFEGPDGVLYRQMRRPAEWTR